jgi:hypothetical protein
MLRKRRVPLLLQDLQHGLLDQSVDDARHAKLSDPAVRFGYFDPLDRLWLNRPPEPPMARTSKRCRAIKRP